MSSEEVKRVLEEFGGTVGLLDYMASAEDDIKNGTRKRDLLKEAELYTDLIRYFFNHDNNFRYAVSQDPKKLDYILVLLVLSGNLDKAEKALEYARHHRISGDKNFIINILLQYYLETHNYDIVNFLLKYFPNEVNSEILKLSEYLSKLTKQDLDKFISDKRIHGENKIIMISKISDKLTIEEMINYYKQLSGAINRWGLENIISGVLLKNKDDRIDKLSYVLKNYSQLIPSESIKEWMETVITSHSGKLTKDDIVILSMLLDVEKSRLKR
jgi:hypothetical protein